MTKSLFLMANRDKDTKAQKHFTKVTFHGLSDNNELSKLDIWINLSILYDISDFVKQLVYERDDYNIDLSEFFLHQIKEFIYYLHGAIYKPIQYGYWIPIMDKLLIEIANYISDQEIVNLAYQNDPTIKQLYNINDIENLSNYLDNNKDFIYDKYLEFHKLWIKYEYDMKQTEYNDKMFDKQEYLSESLFEAISRSEFETSKYIKEIINIDNIHIPSDYWFIDDKNFKFYCELFQESHEILFAKLMMCNTSIKDIIKILQKNEDLLDIAISLCLKKENTYFLNPIINTFKFDINEILHKAIYYKAPYICLDIMVLDEKYQTEHILKLISDNMYDKFNYLLRRFSSGYKHSETYRKLLDRLTSINNKQYNSKNEI